MTLRSYLTCNLLLDIKMKTKQLIVGFLLLYLISILGSAYIAFEDNKGKNNHCYDSISGLEKYNIQKCEEDYKNTEIHYKLSSFSVFLFLLIRFGYPFGFVVCFMLIE